jgi:hypothetical protein
MMRRATVSAGALALAEPDAWKSLATSTFILTDGRVPPWLPAILSSLMRCHLRRAGLPPHLNCHGLMNRALTELAQAQCTPHEIMAIGGHASLRIVARCTKSADQRRLAAVVRLAEWKSRPAKASGQN